MKTKLFLLSALLFVTLQPVSAYTGDGSDVKAGIGYGYTFIMGDGYDSKLGFSALLYSDYSLGEYVYAGAGLGFNYSNLVIRYGKYKYDSNGYGLEIPLYAGFAPFEYFKIDTGPTFSYALAGNTKTYYGTEEIDKVRLGDSSVNRFGAGWRFSVRILDFVYASANISFASGDLTSITVGFIF